MDTTKPSLLAFKWTVSKGHDTYGYNICSLYVDGSKVASCNGGGYDMEGTVLAQYLVREFQERLMTIADRARVQCIQHENMEWSRITEEGGLYGMTYLKPKSLKPHVTINGACGSDSVLKIAKEAGITLNSTKIGRNAFGYFLTV